MIAIVKDVYCYEDFIVFKQMLVEDMANVGYEDISDISKIPLDTEIFLEALHMNRWVFNFVGFKELAEEFEIN